MPNIIRPEERPPYPWTIARSVLRAVGCLALAGAVLQAVGLSVHPPLAWFDRPPLPAVGFWRILYWLLTAGMAVTGVGLVALRPWGRWAALGTGALVVVAAIYSLIVNALARETDWTWAAAAIGGILLVYAMSYPFAPAFAPRPPDDEPGSDPENPDSR
ncbi:MAG: hypothetical protein GF399_03130 [Candidatus Coatesbacteria bacterium]|nr:hypothetical protein [Candidatus Coatesbacteria bacterium]